MGVFFVLFFTFNIATDQHCFLSSVVSSNVFDILRELFEALDSCNTFKVRMFDPVSGGKIYLATASVHWGIIHMTDHITLNKL